MFLQRHSLPGRPLLIAMLTFPLAFPGVVIGVPIILLAGRSGPDRRFSNRLLGEKLVFALFDLRAVLGYIYSRFPVILTIMARANSSSRTGRGERSLAKEHGTVQRTS